MYRQYSLWYITSRRGQLFLVNAIVHLLFKRWCQNDGSLIRIINKIKKIIVYVKNKKLNSISIENNKFILLNIKLSSDFIY